ncbi:MAG: 2-oxoglutarate dehydrogenase E1 component [Bacteroidales bacterium]|nr:2-oxoglutarate dehydrogenase E1 component [Bacteroidales bacterium]MBN2819820.1 2-oxoglutarate dehydrogenase E1 component [Bacteroidales bacterium]
MSKLDFLGAMDPALIDDMYKKYLSNPESVEKIWQGFFSGFEFARKNYSTEVSGNIDKEFRVINFIHAYRRRGHLFTKTNPVRTRRQYFPTLDIENYGFEKSDLNTVFQAGKEIGIGPVSLQEIINHLEETYCSSVGVEYLFIRSPEKLVWLQNRFESTKNKTHFKPEEKKQIYNLLNQASGFEQFIHKKFVGQKRFSLEGSETLIPALHYILLKGSESGIAEYVIGMPHRGRLNVLANILKKPYENIFQEFVAEAYEDNISLGDVKYHLGYSNKYTLENGKEIDLHLAPNPSHLETVSPIIQGITKSKIDHKYSGNKLNVLPILLHGDAAIAGQGIVYEVAQMMELEGYGNGGTIHIVINNQVGFTTNYLEGRSSTYSTDIGKVTKCPIFHINGDNVEALIHTINLAIDYRQTFHTDVFIDILSYRKYGHNESDEPRYTQPTLYKKIANHPNPREIYAENLLKQGVFTKNEIEKIKQDFEDLLEEKLEISKKQGKVKIQRFMKDIWASYKYASDEEFDKFYENKVSKEKLIQIGNKICYLPDDKKFISKTYKLVKDRIQMLEDNKLDWAMAELLAYATLVDEGYPVRLSGQDSVRGTFAHRHAEHVIEDTDKKYSPLKNISEHQASFTVFNSPLNEYGVLGFEYGYALGTPNGLTIWEAQFGDFHNVAQVIIDQYISSAEEKWGLSNGLVLMLPHGFEGQGPEHSSGRIERFLSLAARNNMQIVVPTTPANIYHVLREQVYRNFRIPLILFTPKSLLRHPSCYSSINELAEGTFSEVIDDESVDTNEVRRIVFCSGKMYYDLLAEKEKHNARDIALIRIEQLHPFPRKSVEKILKKYKNSMLNLWLQEEPANMGAWRHVQEEFKDIDIYPICRQPSGSPATGLFKIHQKQQNELISKVFRECVCELNRTYCGLQCTDGSLREKILKQYAYFMEKDKKE